MRILIGLILLAVLAYVGFRTFQPEGGPPSFEKAAGTAQEAAGQAATAARQAADAAGEVAGAATREAGEVVKQAGQAVQQAGQQATAAVGNVDLGAELKGFVDRTGDTLANVRDKASAEAALPSLEATRARLDGFAAQVEQLPAEGRAQLANALNASLPTLRDLSARLGGTEAGPTLKPTLDAIIARLEGWAKAPA